MKHGRMVAQAATLWMIATTLAGCGTPRSVSAEGETGVLKAPAVEIRGATVHDQKWIDETTEAGVQGLGWKRPGPRPPEWDRPLARAEPVAKPPVRHKPGWLRMLRWRETS